MILLPKDLWRHVFSHLGTVQDLGKCAQVCLSFHDIIQNDDSLWKMVAIHRYGAVVTEASLEFYNTCQEMLQDDNKRGALLSIDIIRPCYWKYNHSRYYCCLITAIRWHRHDGRVRLYMDVRGEFDLRLPGTSSIELREDGRIECFRGVWVSELQQETPGHFKGMLSFPDHLFQNPGTYHFCYANLIHQASTTDYESIPILTIPANGTLMDAFRPIHYVLDESPFLSDTAESERQRWEAFLPTQVLDHHRGPRPWWV